MLGVNCVLLLSEGNISFFSVGSVDAWSKLFCVILPEGNINILRVGDKVYDACLVVNVCEQLHINCLRTAGWLASMV